MTNKIPTQTFTFNRDEQEPFSIIRDESLDDHFVYPDSVTQENKRLKEIIMVIDYCLSDYVITEDGIKIVNAKNLDDAQDLLKETVKKFKI